MRFEDRRKNPRVVRFDHWGAAKLRAPTWRDLTRPLSRLPILVAVATVVGGVKPRVDRFHLHILFTAVYMPVQPGAAVLVVNA
jgi:hypothetical protein